MFSLFKKNQVSNTLNISQSSHQAAIKAGQTILDAAIAAGIKFPNMCNVGECGSCRCKLEEGQVTLKRDISQHVNQQDMEQGYILACQSQAFSDITVRVPGLSASDQSVKSYRAQITKQEALADDIQHVQLELDTPIDYLAGQYAQLSILAQPHIKPRNYSFASKPVIGGSQCIDLLIRHVERGEFTGWLFEQNRCGEELQITGPYGDFSYTPSCSDNAEESILCVAASSGLAPILSVLQQLQTEAKPPSVTLVFAARQQCDIILDKSIKEMAASWPANFEFTPVLSQEPKASDWQGRRGRIQDLLEAGEHLPAGAAYLCGPPAMVDEIIDQLRPLMKPENIHFDKFHDMQSLQLLKQREA